MESSTAYTIHKLATELDRLADKLLQHRLGISYGRFYFLLTLSQNGHATQHALANSLGCSDPAVSKMVGELLKAELIAVHTDPEHGRRRLVSITASGSVLVAEAIRLLDECFSNLVAMTGIDETHYRTITERLLRASILKRKGGI